MHLPKKAKLAPGADEEADYKARQRNNRLTTVAVFESDLFHAQLLISSCVKSPVSACFNWMQKMIKQENAARAKCAGEGRAHFGETMVSQLVTKRAGETIQQLQALLTDEHFDDEQHFGLVWALTGDYHAQACALIVELAVRLIASFTFRFDLSETFPWCWLFVVEADPFVKYDRRLAICNKANTIDIADLKDPYNDITIKIKQQFPDELEAAANTGKCPLDLCVCILLWRSTLSGQTQDIEGMNSVLQAATARAPTVSASTINNRMSIKHSDTISVSECVALDALVSSEMKTDWHVQRHVPVPVFPLPKLAPMASDSSDDNINRARYVWAVRQFVGEPTPHACFYIAIHGDPLPTTCFFAGWSHSRRIYIFEGVLAVIAGSQPLVTFSFAKPIRPILLNDYIASVPCIRNRDPKLDTTKAKRPCVTRDLIMHKLPLVWDRKKPTATVTVDEHAGASRKPIRLPTVKRSAPKPASGAAAAPSTAAIQDDGMDEGELETSLEDLVNMSNASEDGHDSDSSDSSDASVKDANECENHDLGYSDDEFPEQPADPTAVPEHCNDDAPTTPLPHALAQLVTEAVADHEQQIVHAKEQGVAHHGTLRDKDISLFSDGRGDISFVYWKSGASMEGRRLVVGRTCYIKAIVFFKTPPEPFATYQVHICRVPAAMLMRKQTEGADRMPQWCLVYERWLRSKTYTGPFSPADLYTTHTCLLCTQVSKLFDADLAGFDRPRPTDLEPMFLCDTCCSYWHVSCIARLDPGSSFGKFNWHNPTTDTQPTGNCRCMVCAPRSSHPNDDGLGAVH